jgi:hypothetical protein
MMHQALKLRNEQREKGNLLDDSAIRFYEPERFGHGATASFGRLPIVFG